MDIQKTVTVGDWTPVGTKMPDDLSLVLLALVDEEVWPGFHDGGIWRNADATPIETWTVTHWMHFPPAPMKDAA